MKKEGNKFGFSIIELLLAFGIVILIVTGVVLAISGQIKKSRVNNFKDQMSKTVPYLTSCLSDNGMLLKSENNDMIAENGGEICSLSGHGMHTAPKERGDCDGDGIYEIIVNSQINGFEADCNLNKKGEKCVAVCTTGGCEFTGKCY